MWVKVCGTTTAEDARVAVEAGADAVGFVMVRASRRFVGVEAVASISEEMERDGAGVERVGVFDAVDYLHTAEHVCLPGEVAAAMVREARAAGLTGVQVHGSGSLGLLGLSLAVQEAAPELRVVPVVSWEVGPEAAEVELAVRRTLEQMQAVGLRRVLVDSKVGAATGGTGVPFAWEAGARAMEGLRDGMELVVAGGLAPETVEEAVRVLRPWGVDVASGVEAVVGRKDGERVRRFVRAARGG